MTANFAAILEQQADDTKAPVQMPIGTYDFVVRRHEFGESSQKKTPYCRFIVSPTNPHEDVDSETISEIENWQQKEFRITRYLTNDAMFMLKTLVETVFQMDTENKSYAELIPETTNQVFTGELVQIIAGKGNNQRPITVLDDDNLAAAN